MDMVSGASYFFNLKTGESSEEHPNLKQAQAVEKRQRQQGEEALGKRLALLREYEEKLLAAQVEKVREYQAVVAAVWADHPAPRAEAVSWVR